MQKSQGYINSKGNNSYIHLYDILNVLPNNRWYWKLFIFEGVGHAPNHMTIPDFEEWVDSLDKGYRMTWCELNKFVDSMDIIYNCLLLATSVPTRLLMMVLKIKIFQNMEECKILIELFDSNTGKL